MFHCATHNLKNMRGQFWMSKDTGSKFFYDTEGHIIGKYIFEDAWLRDKERTESNSTLQKTNLRLLLQPIQQQVLSKHGSRWCV